MSQLGDEESDGKWQIKRPFCYSRCASARPASISWHPLVWAHISKLSPLTPDTPHGAARSSISCDRVLPANAPRFLFTSAADSSSSRQETSLIIFRIAYVSVAVNLLTGSVDCPRVSSPPGVGGFLQLLPSPEGTWWLLLGFVISPQVLSLNHF